MNHSKHKILSILTNKWFLDPPEVSLYEIAKYKLYIMTREEFLALCAIKADGTINIDHTEYCVIYRSCSPDTIQRNTDVRISLRTHSYGNFALVQPIPKIRRNYP